MILFLVVLLQQVVFAQKTLNLQYKSLFGKEKSFQFFNNSKFTCKTKGELFFHTRKLVNMNDSLLLFDNDKVVRVDEIKSIQIRGINISPLFFGAGVLFLGLDSFNRLVNDQAKIVDERAVFVCAMCFAGGIITYFVQNKRIRIRNCAQIQIIDSNYQQINQ